MLSWSIEYDVSERGFEIMIKYSKFENCNISIIKDMINNLPEVKKITLSKALDRNEILTTVRTLSNQTLVVYKEGWYLKLEGTRSKFSVWAWDNDGEFVIDRKPNENKLSPLFEIHEVNNSKLDDFFEDFHY